MTASGLSGCPSRCPQLPFSRLGSRHVRVMAFSVAGKSKQGMEFLQVKRYTINHHLMSLKIHARFIAS